MSKKLRKCRGYVNKPMIAEVVNIWQILFGILLVDFKWGSRSSIEMSINQSESEVS
jgi:hypothetical protein